jgi:hypothetical protein
MLCLRIMRDATSEVQKKMQEAGLSAAAIQAFLNQYQKVVLNEAGLIPESSLTPVEELPSVTDQPDPGNTSVLAAETVVLTERRSRHRNGIGKGEKSAPRARRSYFPRRHRSPVSAFALQGRSTVSAVFHE